MIVALVLAFLLGAVTYPRLVRSAARDEAAARLVAETDEFLRGAA